MNHVVKVPPLLLMSFVIGLFSMLGALSIDIYFPSFGAMEVAFNASPASIQQTLTAYMLPYAVATLFYGPLSDAIGRRNLLLISLAVFGVASLACALSDSLETLLLWRAVQGISAGAAKVLGRTIARDLYPPAETQKVMAWVGVLFGVAPACAPIIGGWLQVWVGWQGPFLFVAVFTLAVFTLTWRVVPETHPVEKRLPLNARSLLEQCSQLLGNMRFVGVSLVLGLGFAPVFLYIASVPRIVIHHWGLSETDFGYFAVPVIIGMVAGGLIAVRLAGRMSRNRSVMLGLALTLVFACLALAASLAGASPLLAVLPVAAMAVCTSLIFPALTVEALDTAPQARGTASSLSNAISLAVIGVVGGVLSPTVSGTAASLAMAAIGLSILSLLCWAAVAMPRREAAAIAPTIKESP